MTKLYCELSQATCTYMCPCIKKSKFCLLSCFFVLLIIDYSTKKGVLVYSRQYASEIVYFRSNPYRNHCELMC